MTCNSYIQMLQRGFHPFWHCIICSSLLEGRDKFHFSPLYSALERRITNTFCCVKVKAKVSAAS